MLAQVAHRHQGREEGEGEEEVAVVVVDMRAERALEGAGDESALLGRLPGVCQRKKTGQRK